MEFEINKGIGRTVEFKGLKAQYLYFFSGALLVTFLIVVILLFAQTPILFVVAVILLLGGGSVWFSFKVNKKYGQYGLMKLLASKRRPSYLYNNKRVYERLKNNHETI